MDELELLQLSMPDLAPSTDTVARHRLELIEVMGTAGAPVPDRPAGGGDRTHHRPGGPQAESVVVAPPRRWAPVAVAAAILIVAVLGAGALRSGEEDPTRVVTAPADQEATTTSLAATGPVDILPCGSRRPARLFDGPNTHDSNEMLPETVTVRLYACRAEIPTTLIGPDGQAVRSSTTLREAIERFGGLKGSVLDEFGRAHPISLAPLAEADPDTTLLGLSWSGWPRDKPLPPADQPPPRPEPESLRPPWATPPF